MAITENIKIFSDNINKDAYESFVLGIDIGGTSTNIGVAGVKDKKTQLLFSQNFDTLKLVSIIPVINSTLDIAFRNYGIKVDFACIGAAGFVSSKTGYVDLTNISWKVDRNEILQKTSLQDLFIINDFEAIGYGINFLNHENSEDIKVIRNNSKSFETPSKTRVILGAGTGLGKSILVYDKTLDLHVPIPSEGGHADFPYASDFEKQLVEFIKKSRNIQQPITYEEILSGRGIVSIYLFLREVNANTSTLYSEEIENTYDKASLISKYRNHDETCKTTFDLFTRFYARCAKNFVLDTLAVGGIYLAGGIAAKNSDIFSNKIFLSEFENAYHRTDMLKDTPIYVIMNYDVSLYGACFAAMYKGFTKKTK